MRLPTLFTAASILLTTLISPSDAAIGPGRVPASRKPTSKIQDFAKKYFQEPGGDNELGHYDARYFTGTPVSYDERTDTLHHLVRSYLTTFRERNIETWIAHGTLLGWWWNGKIMPWDWDLDVQVSASTLQWLSQNLNMTTHNYTSVGLDGGKPVTREYLLDVNPDYTNRVRGNGMNVIDARWIDVRNGLFIDITGLSETMPSSQPGVWSCKNFHRYRTRDLYPLRETVFEGAPAMVPYSFDKILTEEYTARALTKTFHQGHRWIPEQKEWVKQPTNQRLMVSEDKAQSDNTADSVAVPHVPRSLQADQKPKAGLGNLLRVL